MEVRLDQPVEDRSTEFKQWLDLSSHDDQSNVVHALIALVNFGGGQLVLGFKSDAQRNLVPADNEAPSDVRAAYPAERIQQIVSRYSTEPFEVTVEYVERPGTQIRHPIINAPAGYPNVVFPKRGSPDGTSLLKGKLYTRLAGPRSDAPQTSAEWSEFIDGLVARRRDKLVELLQPLPFSTAQDSQAPKVDEPRRRTVRDRMSDARPSPTAASVNMLIENLDSDEQRVLASPISEKRVSDFEAGIREQMTKSMPMMRLFAENSGLTFVPTYDEAYRFVLRRLSFKGPFVDNSNWHMMGEREFALGLDGYLMNQWVELIEARADDERITPDLESIKAFVRTSRDRMLSDGASPDLVLLLNFDRGNAPLDDLWRDNEWWSAPRPFHGADVHEVTFVNGQMEHMPVLEYGNNVGAGPLVAVIDTTDYELAMLNANPDTSDYLSFTVSPVNEARAGELLMRTPDLAHRLYEGQHHTPGSYGTAEAILRLQLMAEYRLDCAGELREKHHPRTIAAYLA